MLFKNLSTFFCLLPIAISAAISYNVEFEGIQDINLLKTVKAASQLSSQKKRPPNSIHALRYRAEEDIPSILRVMHSYGYYEAKVDIQIHSSMDRTLVSILIYPGSRYRLKTYDIHLDTDIEDPCAFIRLNNLGIELNKPIHARNILNAELKVLRLLAEHGFPLAEISNREMIADGRNKEVTVDLYIKTGQMALFGPLSITGSPDVKSRFFRNKVTWKEGDVYDSRLIEKTQTKLIDSELFSSVLVRHKGQVAPDGYLPIQIDTGEAKYRTISMGLSYQTVFGPGVTFGWENRNISQMGRRLSIQGDFTHMIQTGIARYWHADFYKVDQDFISQAEAQRESLYAYSSRSYNATARIERKFNEHVSFSYGVKPELLYVSESVENGTFWLVEVPLYLRYTTANSLLNPTKGVILEYVAVPTFNMRETQEKYLYQQISESTYWPLDKNNRVVLAQRMKIASILSHDLEEVPVPKRLLGGTDEDLRGYRYRTVSPLEGRKPIGGRAAIYLNFEARIQITKTIGLVPFFDLGNVQTYQHLALDGKWFKSVGLGLRYFTFVGPFRLDIAFPLDRRKHIDSVYKILVSIGQTF
ncbi:MAG: autotransporter assembly complex protein TamA [Candidatus Rhabdochlamydia sp.]